MWGGKRPGSVSCEEESERGLSLSNIDGAASKEWGRAGQVVRGHFRPASSAWVDISEKPRVWCCMVLLSLRRREVTVVDKANVLECSRLWREADGKRGEGRGFRGSMTDF